ncbi:hypothetical protein K7432_009280 [Basidiobolus ranarum]|uniref:Uncharacterized protein n=1 Tax=Basidiobolus ranarum TaxID=34480 RepID=A0ABR2VXB5_9FUNG
MISVEKMLRSVLHLLNKGVIDGVIWPLSQTSEDDFPREIHFDNSTIPIEKILNNEYNNIRILTFGPQFSILSHPNTVLFVSHGGLDSSNEAILTGTKVLNIPIFGDHFYNSGNLETVGVSIPMELKTFTSPEMIEKMTLLVEDKDRNFEKNVRHMQILAHINSRRINNAADVAEQLIYTKKSVNLSNRLYQRAESRMSFWEVHNYDVYFIILTTFVGLIYIFAKSAVWFMDTLNPSIQSTKVKNL